MTDQHLNIDELLHERLVRAAKDLGYPDWEELAQYILRQYVYDCHSYDPPYE